MTSPRLRSNSFHIAIIGGGAAGLGAAYELAKNGHSAEVFEQAPFLGGQAGTFLVGGTPVERGYHHLFRSDTAFIDLMEELGLGKCLQWKDSKVYYFHDDRFWPFATPVDLIRFKPLPFIDRLRLGLVTLYLQRLKNWFPLEKHTATEWTRKWLGNNVYDIIFEPMLRGKFGSFHDQISMAWLWNKFALRTASRGSGIRGKFKERLGYPNGSFGQVFEKAAEYVSQRGGGVHVNSPVERIQKCGNKLQLDIRINNGKLERPTYDSVIATVPSYIFPRLVPELSAAYLEKLHEVVYLAAVLVILILDRPLTPSYWTYVGDRTMPFLAVVEHTNFVDPEIYDGNHIVYLGNYLSKEDPTYRLNREELFQLYLTHLKRLNPEFEVSWVKNYYYHREEAAQPIVTKGYSSRIPEHRTPIKGLYLANTSQIYPEDRGTNYSVRLGRRVANMVIQDLSESQEKGT